MKNRWKIVGSIVAITLVVLVALAVAWQSHLASQYKMYDGPGSDIPVKLMPPPPTRPASRRTTFATYGAGDAVYRVSVEPAPTSEPSPSAMRVRVECNGKQLFTMDAPGWRYWRGLRFAPRDSRRCSNSFQLNYQTEAPDPQAGAWDVVNGVAKPTTKQPPPLSPTHIGAEFDFPWMSGGAVVEVRLTDRSVRSISVSCLPKVVHPTPVEPLAFNPEVVDLLGNGDEWCRDGKIPVRLSTLDGRSARTFDLAAGADPQAAARQDTPKP